MHPLPGRLAAVLLLTALPALAQDSSDRIVEILRYECFNELGRREVTLFGNGTIRLRDGEIGKEAMGLAELGPRELNNYLNRLREVDLSRLDPLERGVEGGWIERCDLTLHLPGSELEIFHFGRYDYLPHDLSRILRIAEELDTKVRDIKKLADELPVDYDPRPNDVLRRADGELYRVIAFTMDKRGIELEGVNTPITMFVLRDRVRREFVALISRQGERKEH
jgi:hypothetical protein